LAQKYQSMVPGSNHDLEQLHFQFSSF